MSSSSRPLSLRAGLAAFVLAGHALAVPYTAVTSGPWYDPATWAPVGIPGPGDTATILPGFTVWWDDAAFPAPAPINVDSLTVLGTLVADNTPGSGASINIFTDILTVNAPGEIRGQDAFAPGTPGGSVLVGPGPGGDQQTFLATGDLIGGNGGGGPFGCGGNVIVFGRGTPSGVFQSANASIIRGGSPAGLLAIQTNDVLISHNAAGVFSGGDSADTNCNPFTPGFGCIPWATAGDVLIDAVNAVDILNTTLIKSGDGVPGAVMGGQIFITGFTINIAPGAQVRVGNPYFEPLIGAFGSCAPALKLTTTSAPGTAVFVAGTLRSDHTILDPGLLAFNGNNARVEGCLVRLGANEVRITNRTQPDLFFAPLQLDINVNPGGSLTFQNVQNVPLFNSPNTTIFADNINTGGARLSSLFTNQPNLQPGAPLEFFNVLPPTHTITVRPGDTLSFPVTLHNGGGAFGVFGFDLADDSGWLTNPATSEVGLAAGERIDLDASFAIPNDAQPGQSARATFTAFNFQNPLEALTRTYTLTVVGSRDSQPCNRADLVQPFGQLDIFDILEFFNRLSAGDSSANFNNDNFLNIFDIFAFFSLFGAGC